MKIFITLAAAAMLAAPAMAAETGDKKQTVNEEPAAAAPEKAAAPETAAPSAAAETPAPPAEPEKAAPALPPSCPNCFEPLTAGYAGIMDDLKAWTAGMATQAADLDRALYDLQQKINAKEGEIESANQGTDKKAKKAAVKSLTKERKALVKEYGAANSRKSAFYKQFSKELGKKVEAYNETVSGKLKEAQSAASLQ